jgi:hypothetical protein
MSTAQNALKRIQAHEENFKFEDFDNNHRVVLSVGFKASFYFWGGHTPEKRQALVECFEAFEALYGQHLQYAIDGETGRTLKLPHKKVPPLRQYVQTLDEDDCVAWYLASGEDDEAVPDYAISCLTERGWMDGDISFFQFQVPYTLIFDQNHQEELLNLVLFCHERLAPLHGHAGLSTANIYEAILWEPEQLDLARDFMGLYIDDNVTDSLQAPNGHKGPNWLTFIGNTLTERLGGPAQFVLYCQRFGVEAKPHGKGFVIQAGEFPQLGPVDEPLPADYVRVNAALRPLRNGNFGSMGSGSIEGEMRFNRSLSDFWIRRFDAPDTWPPKSFVGLLDNLVGKPVQKPLTLQTGEVCQLHGRYRHSGFPVVGPDEYDNAPHVVLLPGDVAPYWLNLGPHGEFLGKNEVNWVLVAEL